MYDDYYDGILTDAYDTASYNEWSDASSNEYDMWSDTSSDVYDFWSDISGELWDNDIEKAREKMDEYCGFMKKYMESPDDLSLLTDYTEYMKQYAETTEKMDKLGGAKCPMLS